MTQWDPAGRCFRWSDGRVAVTEEALAWHRFDVWRGWFA